MLAPLTSGDEGAKPSSVTGEASEAEWCKPRALPVAAIGDGTPCFLAAALSCACNGLTGTTEGPNEERGFDASVRMKLARCILSCSCSWARLSLCCLTTSLAMPESTDEACGALDDEGMGGSGLNGGGKRSGGA